jgi:hypothetical protein
MSSSMNIYLSAPFTTDLLVSTLGFEPHPYEPKRSMITDLFGRCLHLFYEKDSTVPRFADKYMSLDNHGRTSENSVLVIHIIQNSMILSLKL